MKIWERDKDGRLYKDPFETKHSNQPVDNFFDVEFPALTTLILEELMRENGARWIVFNEAEAAEILKTARIYVKPEQGICSCHFLDCILEPVKKTYHGSFTVTYIDSQSPELTLPPYYKDSRLAIHIES